MKVTTKHINVKQSNMATYKLRRELMSITEIWTHTHTHKNKNHAQFIDKWIHFLNIWLKRREQKNSLETTGSMQHFQSGIIHILSGGNSSVYVVMGNWFQLYYYTLYYNPQISLKSFMTRIENIQLRNKVRGLCEMKWAHTHTNKQTCWCMYEM